MKSLVLYWALCIIISMWTFPTNKSLCRSVMRHWGDFLYTRAFTLIVLQLKLTAGYSMYHIFYIFLSACLLQKQSVDYARVREYSLRVLQWRPGDVKALYRAGVATLEMGDAQTAKQYLTQACGVQPNGKKRASTAGLGHRPQMNSYIFKKSPNTILQSSTTSALVMQLQSRDAMVRKFYKLPTTTMLVIITGHFIRHGTCQCWSVVIVRCIEWLLMQTKHFQLLQLHIQSIYLMKHLSNWPVYKTRQQSISAFVDNRLGSNQVPEQYFFWYQSRLWVIPKHVKLHLHLSTLVIVSCEL